MSKNIVGYIYILTNGTYILDDDGQYKEIVKIGYTDAHRLQDRIKELSDATGVSADFHAYATYGVHKRLVDLDFSEMIKKLNPSIRYNPKREFYIMSPQTAYEILECIAKINGLEGNLKLNPLKDDYFDKNSRFGKNDSSQNGTLLYITARGTDAICKKINDKKYILLKGSLVSADLAPSCPSSPKKKRLECEANGSIDKNHITTRDMEFSSPSGVAQFVTGSSISGTTALKENK